MFIEFRCGRLKMSVIEPSQRLAEVATYETIEKTP